MDPNYVDEEEEAAALAAMMGFSGFGSHKPPAKKRKFTTDAFVEGQEIKTLDKGGTKGQGSGGNQIPLGKARVFGSEAPNKAPEVPSTNDAEIDLDDDDEDEADGPQYVDTSLPPPILAADEGGPQYVDTSEPPPVALSDEDAKEMQLRIDAILASVQSRDSEPVQPPAPGKEGIHSIPQRPSISSSNAMADSGFMRGGPRQTLGGDNSLNTFSDTASIASSRTNHRGGPRNENWYLDYYDPSFNENPWERLEKEKGLEPLGNWRKLQDSKKLT
ncbi:hypothetical protein D0Z07_8901 [Hyphodiscus hymeniophilus]|uniref:Uncharacterized protein n=1 Tax=Hyphodiscus hymeniophilus TaxID=353542 RepID=A0A9P6VDX6_9HELO|nr:hypothetical protein D0Z07_8901 [Hyphodiscus hymeniophilus]